MLILFILFFFFFFNDTATTEIYTLSLHDALPISHHSLSACGSGRCAEDSISFSISSSTSATYPTIGTRSEEHTSELQSPCNLVCRLLLEKKKKVKINALRHDLDVYRLVSTQTCGV